MMQKKFPFGTYVGELSSPETGQVMSGKGKLTYPNGTTFEGSFYNNQRHGFGTQRSADGKVVWSGMFKRGLMEGKGVLVNQLTGVTYRGNFVKSKMSGKGRLSTQNLKTNESFTGEFLHGKYHGGGILVNQMSCVTYVGNWRNGMKEGQFREIYESGDEKTVSYVNDVLVVDSEKRKAERLKNLHDKRSQLEKKRRDDQVKSLKGKRRKQRRLNSLNEKEVIEVVSNKKYPNGASYSGPFSSKVGRHGPNGKLVFSNNAVYVGSFQNDKITGFGKLKWPNGCYYIGQFVNGKQQGLGRVVYCEGGKVKEIFGGWKDGKKDGKMYLFFVGGKVMERSYVKDTLSVKGRDVSLEHWMAVKGVMMKSYGKGEMKELFEMEEVEKGMMDAKKQKEEAKKQQEEAKKQLEDAKKQKEKVLAAAKAKPLAMTVTKVVDTNDGAVAGNAPLPGDVVEVKKKDKVVVKKKEEKEIVVDESDPLYGFLKALKLQSYYAKLIKNGVIYDDLDYIKEKHVTLVEWERDLHKDRFLSACKKKSSEENEDEDHWVKVAFVAGVGSYEEFPQLKGAKSDAKAIANLLKSKGFHVYEYDEEEDLMLEFAQFIDERRDYFDKNKKKGSKLITMIFFSGHGVWAGTSQCLLPTDFKKKYLKISKKVNSSKKSTIKAIQKKLLENSLSKKSILLNLREPKGKNILILDCCRNEVNLNFNLEPHSRDATNEDYLVAYSTKLGNVASDMSLTGKHSPYTHFLLKRLKSEKKKPIEYVFGMVMKDVCSETDNQQTPDMEVSVDPENQFVWNT